MPRPVVFLDMDGPLNVWASGERWWGGRRGFPELASESGRAREAFVARRGADRVKLVGVDPHVGITGAQVAEVEPWLRVVGGR